jgi:hypothetical protein
MKDLQAVGPRSSPSTSTNAIVLSVALLFVPALCGCTTPRVTYYQVKDTGAPPQADIYSVQEDGSDLIALATSPDAEYPCGFTSDKRVVFTRVATTGQLNVYIVNADGTNLQPLATAAGANVCFGVSADDRIIYTRAAIFGVGASRDVFSVKPDGGDVHILANSVAHDEFPFAITSNNRVIFGRQDSVAVQDSPGYSILSIPAAGGSVTPIMGFLTGANFEGVTSKGTVIMGHKSNTEIWTKKDDGSGTSNIASQWTNPLTSNYFKAPYGGLRKASICAITGDDRFLFDLAGVYQAGDQFVDTWVVNADGTGLQMVHHPNRGALDSCAGYTYNVAVIRRSTPITPYGCTSCENLLAVPLTGGTEVALGTAGHRYTFQTGLYDRVLFRENSGSTYTLYAVNADGTNLKMLDQSGIPQSVRGNTLTQMIFERDTQLWQSTELYSVPIDGSSAPVLLANPGKLGFVAK